MPEFEKITFENGFRLLLSEDGAPALGEAEQRLVQTVAGFLGRQMES